MNSTNSQWFSMLGRERELAVAELAAISPASSDITKHGSLAVGTGDMPNWDRVGGSQRAGIVIGKVPTNNSAQLIELIQANLPKEPGKLQCGLSAFGITPQRYTKLWRDIKIALRVDGRSVRMITGAGNTVLSAAQVIHNGLTKPTNAEFIVWEHHHELWVGRTTWVQDIDAYTARDRERPARDSRVGMLPPKLAQIMINLARAESDQLVFDPFCGTGVILQEALLMGYDASGSDNSSDMIVATQKNIEWLQSKLPISAEYSSAYLSEAQSVTFPKNREICIVCEGYLGRPQSDQMTLSDIESEQNFLNPLYRSVFSHWHRQSSIRSIVIALPYWHLRGHDHHLSFLDSLETIGYTCEQFAPNKTKYLQYRRPDQRVGRMIIRLIKE
ncbi:MAG: hypothetical protein WCI47_00630 [bacterium]